MGRPEKKRGQMETRPIEIVKTGKESEAALMLREVDVSIRTKDSIRVREPEADRKFTDRTLYEISRDSGLKAEAMQMKAGKIFGGGGRLSCGYYPG